MKLNPKDMMFAASLFTRTIESLSPDELGKIAKTFLGLDVVVSPELREAAVKLMQTQDINVASDIIKSPEAVKDLVNLMRGHTEASEPPRRIHQCRHCSLFDFVD